MSYNTFPKNPFPPNSEDYGGGGSSYELPIASAETLGGVKVGTGLSINSETGSLSNSNPTPYSLPIASAETLGGVKVGTGLSIEDGVISANNQLVDYSTNEVDTGIKWIDNKEIYRIVKPYESSLIVSNSTWTAASLNIPRISTLISAYGVFSDACYPLMSSYDQDDNIKLLACRDGASVEIDYAILTYTKTTI